LWRVLQSAVEFNQSIKIIDKLDWAQLQITFRPIGAYCLTTRVDIFTAKIIHDVCLCTCMQNVDQIYVISSMYTVEAHYCALWQIIDEAIGAIGVRIYGRGYHMLLEAFNRLPDKFCLRNSSE